MAPAQQPKGVEWSSVKIGLKELIAALVFVVTMAGVYYRLYYQQDSAALTVQSLQKQVSDNSAKIKELEKSLQDIREDNIRRDAVESATRSKDYQPMKQVK